MRRKLSLLSGFVAAILLLYPIGTSTYADELTSTPNTDTTLSAQSTTEPTDEAEPSQSNTDTITATEPSQSNTDTITAIEPSQSNTDTITATKPSQSNTDTITATEPSQSNTDTITATEPSQSNTDTTAAIEPSQNNTDTTAVTVPSMSNTDITAATSDTASTDTSTDDQSTSTNETNSSDSNDNGNLDIFPDYYNDSPALSNGIMTDDGVVFDYSGHQESIFGLWFSFSPDDVNLLQQNNSNPRVIVKKGEITASLPLNILPADPTYKGFEFDILKDSQTVYANALSPVYSFSISYMDFKEFNPFFSNIKYVQDFADNPVLLTFKIDPFKVQNWDDVQVRSMDYDGTFQNDPIEIESIDKKTGEITAKVQHFNFCEYGVFEGASGTDTSTDGNTSDDDGSSDPGDLNDYYFDSPVISSSTTTDDGVVFDYSDHPESIFGLWLSLSQDDVNLLEQSNPNSKVIVKKGDITASLPLNILPTDPNYQGFMFEIVKDSQTTYANALSPVYNFLISYMDFTNYNPFNLNVQFVQDFVDNPVLLTFKIDSATVQNWDNVQVKSIDYDGTFQNDPIEIVNINKETGEITAKVLHFDFNEYGVFEIASGSNNNDNSSTGDTSGTDTNGTDITATDANSNVSKGTVTSNGVEFNYSNRTDSLALNLNLSQDDVNLLKNASTNPNIIVDKGDIKISLPLSGLPTDPNSPDSTLPFGINIGLDSNSYPNSISSVYNISIPFTDPQSGQQQYQHDFNKTPVLLTFKVDPAKVKNWDDVQVKYIGDDGAIQSEPIEIVSKNQVTGEIVAKVLHFSSYGVFEIASTNTISNNDNGTTGSNNSNSTQTSSNTTTTSTAATSGTTAGSAVTANTVTTTGSLPNTAGNSYNILMLGLALIVLGGILYSFRNRNLKHSK
jgi:LPXTG-motif cell wall-anchored protein